MANEYHDILWIDQQIEKLEKKISSLKEVKEMYLLEAGTTRVKVHPRVGTPGNEQNEVMSLKDKVLQSIKNAGKFKTSDAITDDLESSYPNKDRKILRADISKILSDAKRDEKLVAYEKGRTRREGFLWGFQEWLEGSHIKKEYMP